MTGLFPDGVPGYEAQDGVTVETRLHPEQMPLGLREGGFQFFPRLEEGTGYSSNALPGPYRRASWQILTSAALAIASDWSRDAFGAVFSVQDTRYVALPSQNRADGTVSVGGRLDVGDNKLTVAAAHVAQHEDRGQVNTIASDRPIAFQLDDVRASYAVTMASWSIVPAIQATNWTYGRTTIAGASTSQSYRDRTVVQGGVTVRYEFAPLREAIFVIRVADQDYGRTPAGQASANSQSFQILAGIGYDESPIWRWRVLAGEEVRRFANPLYPRQNTLIAEAGVGWSPSGMTTVSATISRDTEDAAREGTSGLVHMAARLTIDHEYLRDLLFKASIGLQQADFFQGGRQTGKSADVGVTWVMNRNVRLSFTYGQTDLRGSGASNQALVAGYSRGIGLITLRMAL